MAAAIGLFSDTGGLPSATNSGTPPSPPLSATTRRSVSGTHQQSNGVRLTWQPATECPAEYYTVTRRAQRGDLTKALGNDTGPLSYVLIGYRNEKVPPPQLLTTVRRTAPPSSGGLPPAAAAGEYDHSPSSFRQRALGPDESNPERDIKLTWNSNVDCPTDRHRIKFIPTTGEPSMTNTRRNCIIQPNHGSKQSGTC